MHISVWATAAERQKVESAIHHLIAMFAAHDVTVTAASGHNVLVGEDHAVEADRLTVNAPKLAPSRRIGFTPRVRSRPS
jgi:hypothetical protein